MKTLRLIGLALMAVIISFGVSACSDDDDEDTIVSYSMGVENTNMADGSYEEMKKEVGIIEGAYKSAIGVSDISFTKKGSVSECDKEVKAACDKAVSTLQGQSFKGTYTFTVTNNSTNKQIHSHAY